MAGKLKTGVGSVVKQATAATFTVISRTLGFTLLGLGLNLTALIVGYSELYALVSSGNTWQISAGAALIALFLLILPLTFFFFAKYHAVQAALRGVLSKNKSFVTEYLAGKLAERMQRHAEKAEGGKFIQTMHETVPKYLQKLDNMPWVMRMMVGLVAESVDFTRIVHNALDGQREVRDMRQFDWDKFSKDLSAQADEVIEERFLAGNSLWLWLLAGFNIGAVAALKWFG